MTDDAMSPLRRRMIEDMTIRKSSPKIQQGYIRTIKNLAAFLGRSLAQGPIDISHSQGQSFLKYPWLSHGVDTAACSHSEPRSRWR